MIPTRHHDPPTTIHHLDEEPNRVPPDAPCRGVVEEVTVTYSLGRHVRTKTKIIIRSSRRGPNLTSTATSA